MLIARDIAIGLVITDDLTRAPAQHRVTMLIGLNRCDDIAFGIFHRLGLHYQSPETPRCAGEVMRTAGFACIEAVITMAALDFPMLKTPHPDAPAFEGPRTLLGAEIGSL